MWLTVLCMVNYFVIIENKLFCRDENNNIVDWFVAYKLPLIKEHSNKLVQEGVAYCYITSKDVAAGWMLSERSINDSLSITGQTLLPLYANKSSVATGGQPDLLWMLYNDQPPSGNISVDKGHTKGVVMCGPDGGVWLVHSVPHYPPTRGTGPAGYSYPHSGLHYGQSFLCLSLSLQQMDLVGLQLMYNEPQVYNFSLAPHLPVPHLLAAAEGGTVAHPPWFHQQVLSTQQGLQFTSFAKTSQFHKDLYADWVAMALQSDLVVESWLNGKNPLPPSCARPYTVQNVVSVDMNVANANFSIHRDHSKWAVSTNGTGKTWVCVGDINRMASQSTRGGGTVCVQDHRLWAAYSGVVAGITPCSRSSMQPAQVLFVGL
ncbi:deoxyribonuclease-2-alpha isoform X2 [Bacillus rossius redtenbacheri]|uniref:deoxyribonuclease-2-alpha isoform X2 n=1 Tax=Bacillus rossius redtenbacheri TaxID=93214 RepID=UPI002FDE767D